MKFSNPYRLVTLWRATIIDTRIAQLETAFTPQQIAYMKQKAGIR